MYIAKTDWHYDRQAITHTIVPERSEFSLWYRQFPGILGIRSLRAPYPPWRSTNVQVRWMARAHVATHGFTPLEVLLRAIVEGDITEFREEALIVYGASLVELYYCLRGIPEKGTKETEVAQIVRALEEKRSWENGSGEKTATLWERCCDFYDELKQFCGTTGASLSDSEREMWKAREQTLRHFRKELRYITDPDYR